MYTWNSNDPFSDIQKAILLEGFQPQNEISDVPPQWQVSHGPKNPGPLLSIEILVVLVGILISWFIIPISLDSIIPYIP